jgi:tRNA (cytidine/uridine-2'-O-)-methyltransferase
MILLNVLNGLSLFSSKTRQYKENFDRPLIMVPCMLQDFSYRKGDYLLFGAETTGLPPEALLDCKTEPYGGGTIKIPMVETYVRCLNLSVSVGIALYEASRQLNYESLQIPSETCIDTEEKSLITEDIFG